MPTRNSRRKFALDSKIAIGTLPPIDAAGAEDLSGFGSPALVAHSHVFFWITQIMGRRDRMLSREFRPFGVRVTEWRVLLALAVRPRISMSEVADLATVEPTTLSRAVEQMLRAEWVVRSATPEDMRVTRLELTSLGKELFEKLWPIADKINRGACENLPDGAAQLLCLGLRKVHIALDRIAEKNGDSHSDIDQDI